MDEVMTMVYRAADPAMLAAVKPGDKVKFAPDRVNGQFVIPKIEKSAIKTSIHTASKWEGRGAC
jgi:Cu(I)/Ag(I) efflux system periplasmic protein CusF